MTTSNVFTVAVEQATVPPEVTSAFTPIPEIVFVRGCAEWEDMGIFVVEPTNRVSPGDLAWRSYGRMQRHLHDGGGDWEPLEDYSISGTLPVGVSWNAQLCRLEYNGYGPGTASAALNEKVTLRMVKGSDQSSPFTLRILTPTIVYGIDVATLNTAKGWGVPAEKLFERNYPDVRHQDAYNAMTRRSGGVTYENPNVVFVTGGTYRTADGENLGGYGSTSASNAPYQFYMLGDPADRPYFECAAVSAMNMSYSLFGYFKNLKGLRMQIGYGTAYSFANQLTYGPSPYKFILTKIEHYRAPTDSPSSDTGVSTPALEGYEGDGAAFPGTEVWIWNYRISYFGGNANTQHNQYIEGRPHLRLYHNNSRFDGALFGSHLQATVATISLCNTRFNSVPEGYDPATWTGRLPTDAFDLHGCGWRSIYNCWAQVARSSITNNEGMLNGPIFFENRRSLWGGNDIPPYPGITYQKIPDDGDVFTAWTQELSGVAADGQVGDVGEVYYSLTQGGQKFFANNSAVFTGTPTTVRWTVTVDPDDLPQGFVWLWVKNLRTGVIGTTPKHIRTYRDATTFAVSGIWNYSAGTAGGWDMDSVETFVSPQFWQDVAAYGITNPANPLTYKLFWSYNVFEWMNTPINSSWINGIPLMTDKGTEPIYLQSLFGDSVFKRAPEGWAERSCHFFVNNRLVNANRTSPLFNTAGDSRSGVFVTRGPPYSLTSFSQQVFEDGCLWSQEDLASVGIDPTLHPEIDGPGIPDRNVVDNGGNNFQSASPAPQVAIPSWFRMVYPGDVTNP